LAAGQGGGLFLSEIVGGVEVDADEGGSESGQQLAACIAVSSTDDNLGAHVGARLCQWQDEVIDDGPGLYGADRLIESVNDHVKQVAAPVGEGVSERRS